MASDDHMVGLALGHARCDGAHAQLGDQLDADVGMGCHVFQVVDELCQIFNRVDVMVRRRRDQAHTGHRVTQKADVLRHLGARQLTAFARLGTLGHLDLDLIGTGQVFGGHAKTARGHLLDLGAQRVARQQGQIDFHLLVADDAPQRRTALDGNALEFIAVARRVFAALARVAFAANAVHGHRQGGMGFSGYGTQRHGTGGKALDDFRSGFNLIQGNGFGRVELELEQTAQGHVATALVVDDLGIFFVRAEVVGTGAVLQLGNRVGCPHVVFTTAAPGVFAARIEHGGQHRVVAECGLVHANGFFGDVKNANALDTAGGAGEVLGNGFGVQTNGFEQLGTAVRHVGGHAHLGHDFGQAFANRFDVVVNGFVGRQIAGQLGMHGGQRLHRQIRVHGFCAITGQHGEVVHLARAAGLHHQTCAGAQAFFHQVLVNSRQGQQGWDGHLGGGDGPVADDQDVVAALDVVHGFGAQRCQLGLHTLMAPGQGIGDVQGGAFELALGHALDVAQLGHVLEVEHRLAHLQAHRGVDLVDVEQIRLGADKRHQRHDDGLADRVDWRVGHLGKQLFEVVVERFVFVREHGQGAVIAHGTQGFFPIGGHGCHQELEVFLGVTKRLLAVEQRNAALLWAAHRVLGHIVQTDAQVFNPLLVGLAVGQTGLEFFVVDHAALFQVDQEHLAGLQTPFANNLALGHRQHARL